MAKSCGSCRVRLYGDEVQAGVCDNCADGPGPVRGPAGDEAVGGWEAVAVGVRLLQAGVAVLALFLLVALAWPFMKYRPPVEFLLCLPPLSALLLLAGGYVCCAVPRASGLGGYAWAVGGLLTASLVAAGLFGVAAFLPDFFPTDLLLFEALELLAGGLGFAAGLAVFILLAAAAWRQGAVGLGESLIALPFLMLAALVSAFTWCPRAGGPWCLYLGDLTVELLPAATVFVVAIVLLSVLTGYLGQAQAQGAWCPGPCRVKDIRWAMPPSGPPA